LELVDQQMAGLALERAAHVGRTEQHSIAP